MVVDQAGTKVREFFTGTRCTILTKLPVAFSAGSRLKAVPLPAWMLSTWAFEYAMWIGVDADIDRIARPDGKKLRLLEIRRHPDVARHEHHQCWADRRVIALCRGQPRDTAGDRRGDRGA